MSAVPSANSSRIAYFDLFRGIGIILMVMGHIGFGKTFDYWIHGFHMAMFFWISGFFFGRSQEKPFLSFLKRKAQTLLIPYLSFGLLLYLRWLTYNSFSLQPLIHLLYRNTENLPYIYGALWFLTSLFWTEILYYLICRCCRRILWRAVVVLAVSVFGMAAEQTLSLHLPYGISAACVGVSLCFSGHLTAEFQSSRFLRSILSLPWIPTLLIAALASFLILRSGYINMRIGAYSPMFLLNALLAITAGFNLSKLLHGLLSGTPVCRALEHIGKNSIVFLCLNQYTIFEVSKLAAPIAEYPFLYWCAVLLLTMLVLSLLTIPLTKTKLRILLGKFV